MTIKVKKSTDSYGHAVWSANECYYSASLIFAGLLPASLLGCKTPIWLSSADGDHLLNHSGSAPETHQNMFVGNQNKDLSYQIALKNKELFSWLKKQQCMNSMGPMVWSDGTLKLGISGSCICLDGRSTKNHETYMMEAKQHINEISKTAHLRQVTHCITVISVPIWLGTRVSRELYSIPYQPSQAWRICNGPYSGCLDD